MNRVIVITGAIGVGKSETIRVMRQVLADVVGEVAVLESDHFYMMIDPQWTLPPDRVERYFAVSGWLLREAALGFLRSGFDWVAIATNGHWKESAAREFVQPFVIEGAQVHHITLDPREEVLRQRIVHRAEPAGLSPDEQGTSEAAIQMLREVRAALGPWTHVVDNGSLTPQQTALAIRHAVESGCGRLLGEAVSPIRPGQPGP